MSIPLPMYANYINPIRLVDCYIEISGNDQWLRSREAGRQGSREAGRQGGWEAGKQGSWEAGRLGGKEAEKLGGREAMRPGSYEARKLREERPRLFERDVRT
jgi:hypothetical protein